MQQTGWKEHHKAHVYWSGLVFQFPELPAVQSSASLLTSLSLSFLLCKMGIIRPTPRTAKAGFLHFQPQVKMGFRGVSQSLKLYLGTVCGVCVCNSVVTPGGKELSIGKDIQTTYLVHGQLVQSGPSEETAKLGGDQCNSGPTVGWQGEEAGYVHGDCAISKYTEDNGAAVLTW